jgi:hypothetical protein
MDPVNSDTGAVVVVRFGWTGGLGAAPGGRLAGASAASDRVGIDPVMSLADEFAAAASIGGWGFAVAAGMTGGAGVGGRTAIKGCGGPGSSAVAGAAGESAIDGRTGSDMVLMPAREPAAMLKASLVLSTRVPIMTRDTQTMIAATMMRKSSMRPPARRSAESRRSNIAESARDETLTLIGGKNSTFGRSEWNRYERRGAINRTPT